MRPWLSSDHHTAEQVSVTDMDPETATRVLRQNP